MKHMRFCIHAANNGTSLKKNGTASLLGNIQSVMKGLRRAFIKPNNAMGLQQTSFARRNIKIGRLLPGHGGHGFLCPCKSECVSYAATSHLSPSRAPLRGFFHPFACKFIHNMQKIFA